MNKLLNIYKPQGITPFQLIQQLREKHTEYRDVKIGYAGRLDPLAHGVMLLMVGEATKHREDFLSLPKEYEFEALFGLQTDTYDILGLLQNKNAFSNLTSQISTHNASGLARTINFQEKIKTFLSMKIGTQRQAYPPFSSKAIAGKPLFWWAKNNKLSEIKIPEREIEISQFEMLATGELPADKLYREIKQQVNKIEGSFRQEEILNKWKTFFTTNQTLSFSTARFRINCSSGTYVRGLVNEMGQYVKCGATCLEILRTQVGKYSISDSLRM